MEKEKKKISEEEYLAIEREAEFKSEFYNGEMFALAGASRSHIIICDNISAFFHSFFQNKECISYSSEMKVKIEELNFYTYPDIVIACGKEIFIDDKNDTLLNPLLIIEILSKSTESYDRGSKFEFYRKIYSLKEYVLVSQEKPLIEVFTKDDSGGWVLRDENDINKSVNLSSVNCTIPLSEVYHKIEFEN